MCDQINIFHKKIPLIENDATVTVHMLSFTSMGRFKTIVIVPI